MMFTLLAATAAIGTVDCDRVPPRQIDRLIDLPNGAIEAIGDRMADRGHAFQATDMVLNRGLPNKRFAGAEQHGCILTITYEQGGFAHRWVNIVLKKTGARWALVSRR